MMGGQRHGSQEAHEECGNGKGPDLQRDVSRRGKPSGRTVAALPSPAEAAAMKRASIATT